VQEKTYVLTDRDIVDPGAKRRWSQAYLTLTHARPDDRADSAWRGNADHPLLNWVSAQSAPPMQPPYSAGANRSKLIELLEKGHEDVTLSLEEWDKLTAWIDLGVPFCGDYTEAHAWTEDEVAKYEHYLAKRRRLAESEQRNVAELVGLSP
jgi:hypothetical protein